MKIITPMAIAVLAIASTVAPAAADSIDPNNPTVTNPRVDEDATADIKSRYDDCMKMEAGFASTVTNQQMLEEFNTKCAEFIDKDTGKLAVNPSVTNEQLGVESNTSRQ